MPRGSASKLVAFAFVLAVVVAVSPLAAPRAARAQAAEPAGRAHVYLSWVRLAGADSCPDVRQVADDVARRLGWNPFREAPTQFIEAQIRRDVAGDFLAGRTPGTWVAEIFLRDASGASRGNRVFTSAAASCESLASVMALSIAIVIDPDVMLRRFSDDDFWPAGAVVAPPEARAPRPPPGARGSLLLLGAGGVRMLPRFSPGLGLQGEVRLLPRLTLRVGGVVMPEVRTPAPDENFAFGLTAGWLGACFDVLQHDAVALGACAAGMGGVLHAIVFAPESTHPGERTFWGFSSGLRLAVRLSARVEAQLGGDGVFVLNRRQFTVDQRPPGMDEVFTQPAAAALLWIAVGVRFR